MKRIYLAIIMTAVLIGNVFAGDDKEKNSIEREIPISSPITKIIVHGDVELAITEESLTNLIIEGKPEITEGVRVLNEKGQLRIVAKASHRSDRPKITIPVSQLNSLVIHGDGLIYSKSILHSSKIVVMIDGECTVSLKATGKIIVETTDEYRLRFARNQKIKIKKLDEFESRNF
jgi:Putative auto-transporter adhesin, head GIN domain